MKSLLIFFIIISVFTLNAQLADQSGNNNTADNYSVAMGYGSSANSSYSLAGGFQSTTTGAYSIALGSSSEASGVASIAIGDQVTASVQA